MLAIATLITHLAARLRTVVAAHLANRDRKPMVVLLGRQFHIEVIPPPRFPHFPSETCNLLVRRVQRLAERFRLLAERWRAGTLRPLRPGPTTRARPAADQPGTPARPAYLRLPRARFWAIKHIPGVGPLAGNLHEALQRPDLPALLAEVPRAGRILRPLCRALGVDAPPCLQLPPRPRPPRIRRPRPPRPRRGLLPSDRPLPANIRAAARAWKKTGE